jgi:hypothetical protein
MHHVRVLVVGANPDQVVALVVCSVSRETTLLELILSSDSYLWACNKSFVQRRWFTQKQQNILDSRASGRSPCANNSQHNKHKHNQTQTTHTPTTNNTQTNKDNKQTTQTQHNNTQHDHHTQNNTHQAPNNTQLQQPTFQSNVYLPRAPGTLGPSQNLQNMGK